MRDYKGWNGTSKRILFPDDSLALLLVPRGFGLNDVETLLKIENAFPKKNCEFTEKVFNMTVSELYGIMCS